MVVRESRVLKPAVFASTRCCLIQNGGDQETSSTSRNGQFNGCDGSHENIWHGRIEAKDLLQEGFTYKESIRHDFDTDPYDIEPMQLFSNFTRTSSSTESNVAEQFRSRRYGINMDFGRNPAISAHSDERNAASTNVLGSYGADIVHHEASHWPQWTVVWPA